MIYTSVAMYRNRRARLITVLLALVSLLFMQLAVAGYACPGKQPRIQAAVAMTETAMPCAESMEMTIDDAQPNLCQAYCQAESQSAYKYQLPPFLAVDALPSTPALQLALLPVVEVPLPTPHLQRSTAPPLAIRNCCFRI